MNTQPALAVLGSYSLIQIAIAIIVLAGVIGIVLVVVRQSGIVIPAFITTICWIVLAVVIGVVAIKFLASL